MRNLYTTPEIEIDMFSDDVLTDESSLTGKTIDNVPSGAAATKLSFDEFTLQFN